MTMKEMSQFHYLNREIEFDQARLKQLRAKLLGISSPNYDGMPKSPGCGNQLERNIAEIVDLEAIIQAKITQCLHERNRLERYIAEIPDSLTRQIFKLRFVDGKTWLQVAVGVGGGNTEESVRKVCTRYINCHNQ